MVPAALFLPPKPGGRHTYSAEGRLSRLQSTSVNSTDQPSDYGLDAVSVECFFAETERAPPSGAVGGARFAA
jgi:hypothetical protein